MKKQFALLFFLLLLISCKKDEEVIQPVSGPPLIGLFQVPDNKEITFEMSSQDGFAHVTVRHEQREFVFINNYKMDEVNMIIQDGEYFVRLKTYAKGEDTYVSYLLSQAKEKNVIYGYTGIVKRIK